MTQRKPLTENEQSSDAARRDPVIDSAALLKGGNEVVIRHNGRVYRLRATRLGKLILTA